MKWRFKFNSGDKYSLVKKTNEDHAMQKIWNSFLVTFSEIIAFLELWKSVRQYHFFSIR